MKAILFFTAFAVATKPEIEAAETISKETGKRVVFRNGSIAAQSAEAPEPCLGYAGLVPESDAYKNKTVFTAGKAPAAPKEKEPLTVVSSSDNDGEGEGEEPELNKIGLPLGSPESAKDLKKALDDAEVEYHSRAKVAILADLYRSEVLVLDED